MEPRERVPVQRLKGWNQIVGGGLIHDKEIA